MYLAPYMLGYAGWYSSGVTRDILFFVPFMQVLLIGPVIYFYTQSLLNINFTLRKKDLIHFVPAALYLVYSFVVFIADKLVLDSYYFYADGRDKDLSTWYQVAGFLSMVFYLILSLRFYANYKKLVFDKVSFAESILFKWIQNFMFAFLVILILRGIFFFTNDVWKEFGGQFWHYISFSFVFYYISLNGYANAIRVSTLLDMNGQEVDVFQEIEIASKEKENTSDEKDIKQWKVKILELIAQKRIFENPKLTLSDVSKELGVTTKTVSMVVNSGFQMNFNDFINYHRVEALKEKLQNGDHQKSTLLGLAYDCGFNSKATFNRAFKKNTGNSPKDYLESLNK
jgi:AraC-like DNA-binding protein